MDLSLEGPVYAFDGDGRGDRNELVFPDEKAPREAANPNPISCLPYNTDLTTNPLQMAQGLAAAGNVAHFGVLDQSHRSAAPLILPIEKAQPTIVITNEHPILPKLTKDPLIMGGIVPSAYIDPESAVNQLPEPRSTAMPPSEAAAHPKTTPAVETLSSRRPVRKSSLKRTFNIEDLDAPIDDGGDERANRGKKNKTVTQAEISTQAPHFHPAALAMMQRHQQGPPRRGRPPLKGHIGRMVHQGVVEAPVQRPHAQEVIPCPLDTPCPRKHRSQLKTCPKTSRASIARLKQAAHGNLPLGGSKSLAWTLLGGGVGGFDDKEEGYSSDDSDSGTRHRNSARRQAQSGTKGDSADLYNRQQQQRMAQNFSGPNQDQKKAMELIAAAPPELRAAMLQRLMHEKLGLPMKPTSPTILGGSGGNGALDRPPIQTPNTIRPSLLSINPSRNPPAAMPLLSSLPRSEQQLIVKQLMSQMTPQQRHTMVKLPIPHQAELLQQYYSKYVAPKQRIAPPLDPQHSFPMIPFSGMAPAATVPAPADPLKRQNSAGGANPLPHTNGSSFLRELGGSAEAQFAAMPREQQQKVLLALIQRRRQKLLLQQQQQQQQRQNIDGFGGAVEPSLPVELSRRHSDQVALQNRQGSMDISNPAMMSNLLDRHHSMPPLAGQNGMPGLPPAAAAAVPGGLGDGGGGFSDVGLDGLLGSGGLEPDNDALQDAMNFLI